MSVEMLLSDDVGSVDEADTRTFTLEDADEVFEALASETARQILNLFAESPRTTSEVADDLDKSVQNVSYHIDRLERLGLIDVVGTRYSQKAREMNCYASQISSLQIVVETPDAKSDAVSASEDSISTT